MFFPIFRTSRANFSPQVLVRVQISASICVSEGEKSARHNSFGFKIFRQMCGKWVIPEAYHRGALRLFLACFQAIACTRGGSNSLYLRAPPPVHACSSGVRRLLFGIIPAPRRAFFCVHLYPCQRRLRGPWCPWRPRPILVSSRRGDRVAGLMGTLAPRSKGPRAGRGLGVRRRWGFHAPSTAQNRQNPAESLAAARATPAAKSQ
jgi:hypothetical protein